MSNCKPDCVAIVLAVIAIVLAAIAIVLGSSTWWSTSHEDLNNDVKTANKRLEALDKQLATLTNRSKIEDAVTKHTISLLTGETEELKVKYMKVLNETKALNKTINYTTAATVQRVLDELNNVKNTQKDIQKRLQALSHLNDTAQDYLNLRGEVENLTTHVNQNINRLEGKVDGNRKEWQNALKIKISEIDSKISDLHQNPQNRTNTTRTSDATQVLALRKGFYVMFYTLILVFFYK